jgi:hypothetical protein
MHTEVAFRFLDLLPELRSMIYSICMEGTRGADDEDVDTSTTRLIHSHFEKTWLPRRYGLFKLALVNRLIRAEFLPLYMKAVLTQEVRLQDVSAYMRDFLQPQDTAPATIKPDISTAWERCGVLDCATDALKVVFFYSAQKGSCRYCSS